MSTDAFNTTEFDRLMEGVRAGSPEAARILHEQYESHVLRCVRRRMPEKIRSKFDSIDFTQAVWATFFGHLDEMKEFENSDALVAWLGRIASNKVIDETRRRMIYQKNNVNRECAIDDVHESESDTPGQVTPSQEAIANEQWLRMMADQPENHQQILKLKAQGNSNDEIARALGCNERTVRRVIRKLESRLG